MPREVAKVMPDWVVQATWFAAGICATGAFWYFLSQKDYLWTFVAGFGAVAFASLAVYLHIRKDGVENRPGEPKEEPVILKVNGETVTFTELMRSVRHDVVKVHAYTHVLGVDAEYEWIRKRYPGAERVRQRITTLDLLKGKRKNKSKQVHFDVLTIKLKDGGEKEVYFDISSFFSGAASSLLDPNGFIVQKISDLYKRAKEGT